MFKEIGVLWIDHTAVTTRQFEETARDFLSMPGARTLRGPGWNSSQNVHFLFVTFGGDMCIEILGLPESEESPIAAHVAGGGGAYHLCYAVADLDASLIKAEGHGARLVVAATPDDAYDGRRVAFLMHPDHGLFELVEAYGDFGPANLSSNTPEKAIPVKTESRVKARDETEGLLEEAFKKTFPNGLPDARQDWEIDQIKAWDSLGHMRLIMEIERRLDTVIPSNMLASLNNFQAFATFLAQKS